MIVIAIVSILTSIVIPQYAKWKGSDNKHVEKVEKKSAAEMPDSENRDIIKKL
ncbi:MAG: hypothetical protein PF572_04460 [Patescibacteria group bacterium]|jgi:type II secretory pathway pseudopilin PulG|nr:hypothetical protein [Patescibacteria group bacterium]